MNINFTGTSAGSASTHEIFADLYLDTTMQSIPGYLGSFVTNPLNDGTAYMSDTNGDGIPDSFTENWTNPDDGALRSASGTITSNADGILKFAVTIGSTTDNVHWGRFACNAEGEIVGVYKLEINPVFALTPDTNPGDEILATFTVPAKPGTWSLLDNQGNDDVIDSMTRVQTYFDENNVQITNTTTYAITWSDPTHWTAREIMDLGFGMTFDSQGRPTTIPYYPYTPTTPDVRHEIPIVWQTKGADNVVARLDLSGVMSGKFLDTNGDNLPDQVVFTELAGENMYTTTVGNFDGWSSLSSSNPHLMAEVQSSTDRSLQFFGTVTGDSSNPITITMHSYFMGGGNTNITPAVDYPLLIPIIYNGISVNPDRYSGSATAAGGASLHFQFMGDSSNELVTGTAYNDYINMGGGDDTVNGGLGKDLLYGGDDNDALYGGEGDDMLEGGSGNDMINGGIGLDAAVFSGNFVDYTISYNSAALTYSVVDKAADRDGTDIISEVEYFQFLDGVRAATDPATTIVPSNETGTTQMFPGHTVGEWSNQYAFAALRADGSVVTWGDGMYGGDSSIVASSLNGDVDVTQIFSTYTAFAALRADGSVVTWGDSLYGGDSSSVASSLNGDVDVTQIFSTYTAFAALRADGSVVTWGLLGGDSSGVASSLNGDVDVTQIFSTRDAFAALHTDGSVVTWGDSLYGGDSSSVASSLNGDVDVTQIFSTGSAFAALRADGSVVTWGDGMRGGDSSIVASSLNGDVDVTQIFSTMYAFAALRADGSVVTWGLYAGDSSGVGSSLNGDVDVTQIFSTWYAFAALRTDGSVVTWGYSYTGGDSSSVASSLNGDVDVTQIFSTESAFAALRADGSVVAWGDGWYGGDSSSVASSLNGDVDVTQIFSTESAFAALRADGSVVAWGDGRYGGDCSSVASSLNGDVDVTQIFSTAGAFAALRADGSVVTWGDGWFGGAGSSVADKLVGVIDISNIYTDIDHFVAPSDPKMIGGSPESWLYLASWPDLMAAFGADSSLAALHYNTCGKAEGRGLTFDAWGYLASWADLRGVFGTNLGAAAEHYVEYGRNEGRGMTFDAWSYLASWSDLRGAFGSNIGVAAKHYVEYGANEGRSVTFDAWSYLASWADLWGVFGTDLVAATRHYVEFGANEGRGMTFDAWNYLASWDDLLNAFGSDLGAATRHYVEHGVNEGRSLSFDAEGYLLSYDDLHAAFGTDTHAAILHYVNNGYHEGRHLVSVDGAPVVASFSPVDGVAGVALDSNIVLTFNESIHRGSGNIELHVGSPTGALVESFDVATSTHLAVSGTTLTINPTSDLARGIQYFVTITTGAIKDLSGDSYAGTTSYDFVSDPNLIGTDGMDMLHGGSGNETISALGGSDTLNGGAGADLLIGGEDDDTFVFSSASDIGLAAGSRDVISDFTSGQDQIDLSSIDANSGIAGNQAFSGTLLGGSGVFSSAGQLRYDSVAGVLYGNTDSDQEAEFAIQLLGLVTLNTGDLVL
jgi:Ca2+-binding RTX toxin-like protein/alpha-tubulin suppressor-like RCC1 family protein